MLNDDNHTSSSMHNSSDSAASSRQEAASLTEEERLAEAHQLGKVLKRYKSEPEAFTADGLPSIPRMSGFSIMARGSRAWSILIPMLFITTLAIWLGTHTPPWPLIMICLLILTPWLSTVIGRLPRDIVVALQNAEFYLCTNGLMIIKWTRVQAIRWEQIQGVRQNVTRDRRRSSYILYLNEGKPVTLDRSLVGPEIRELSEAIDCKVSQHLLPGAIAAYEVGQSLNFGPVNVTAQGLTLEDEQQSLPWERFAAIDYFHEYYVTIRAIREGEITSTWQRIEVARMLNLCVFLPLATHIKSSLRASAHQSEDATIHIHEMGEEGAEPSHEAGPRFQEQRHAQEEDLERMRRVHEEILERLRSRRRVTPIPEEVVKALRVLDLSSDATFDEIHHRYRQLAKRYHPDMGGDPETFKQINAAYQCVVTWIEAQNQKNA